MITSRFATLFGLGEIAPFAPGTFGSAVAIPVAWAAHWLGGFPAFAFLLIVAVAVGYAACDRFLAENYEEDPGEVIADEFAGQLVALLPLSFGLWIVGAPDHVFPWPGWVGGFVLFRLFDILKPPPVSTAERLPGAWGVMADDLVAGALAAIVVVLAAAVAHGWFA